MEYLVNKTLPLFLYPLGIAIIAGIIAVLLVCLDKKHMGVIIMLISVSVLWICATPAFSNMILSSLENRYPPVNKSDLPVADAIVVLGGDVGAISHNGIILNLGMSADRLFHALDLYHNGNAPLLILSGGSAPGELSEAEIMSQLIHKYNPIQVNLLFDKNSRNTYENAVNVSEIAKQNNLQKLILVTSASHMRRAVATFTTLGMDVIPAPTDYNVQYPEYEILNWMPDAKALYRSTISIREYLGWWVYKVTGRIKDQGHI